MPLIHITFTKTIGALNPLLQQKAEILPRPRERSLEKNSELQWTQKHGQLICLATETAIYHKL